MDQAKEAAAYAPQCDCTLAETYALEAFTFAKKATGQSSLDEARANIKKAIDLSFNAMNEALKCNRKDEK